MTQDRDVALALLREAKRHLSEESLPRLRKAVSMLDEEQLWHRVNAQTNSVGNLLLHLNGNVRQWIVSGLGGSADERVRSREFETRGGLSAASVLSVLEKTLHEAAIVLDRLDPGKLLDKRTIQGEEVTGLQAVVHVVEHFSYHTGQVAHIVKALENVDLGYYAGRDLDRRNRV
jgi:uncharacterized damage-inducible protein DinB